MHATCLRQSSLLKASLCLAARRWSSAQPAPPPWSSQPLRSPTAPPCTVTHHCIHYLPLSLSVPPSRLQQFTLPHPGRHWLTRCLRQRFPLLSFLPHNRLFTALLLFMSMRLPLPHISSDFPALPCFQPHAPLILLLLLLLLLLLPRPYLFLRHIRLWLNMATTRKGKERGREGENRV